MNFVSNEPRVAEFDSLNSMRGPLLKEVTLVHGPEALVGRAVALIGYYDPVIKIIERLMVPCEAAGNMSSQMTTK